MRPNSSHDTQTIEAVDWFIHGVVFNAGGYFRTDHHALDSGTYLVSLLVSCLVSCQNIEVFKYWDVFHTKSCLQMIFGGELCHVETGKMICEAHRWNGSCVVWFLLEACLCGSGEYTTVLCFSIRGGDGRVSAPS